MAVIPQEPRSGDYHFGPGQFFQQQHHCLPQCRVIAAGKQVRNSASFGAPGTVFREEAGFLYG